MAFHLRLCSGCDLPGEDSFAVYVCSPGHLQASKNNVTFGRHLLIVNRYDFDEILDVAAKHITSFDEPTWPALAEKLSRFGKWEFEDYQPYSAPEP
ncbi:Imm8 family immunity protein [Fibrella arboris]|uniref:Imm8 family immunity protein n=1 Tax=Fibrella arboris TaxID=3242486 RepID=UPI003520691C